MNIYIKVLPLVTLLALSYSTEAKSKEKQSKKVNVKCFIELVGGGDMVSFWHVSQKKVSSLSKSIIGRKVMLLNSKQKAQIYKAYECVLSTDNFTNSRAKIVDAKTAR